MTLYRKIQEFTTLLENVKNDNANTLEYAKNELKQYAKQEILEHAREQKEEVTTLLLEQSQNTSQSLERKLLEKLSSLFTQNKEELLEKLQESMNMQELQESLQERIILNSKDLLDAAFEEYLNINAKEIAKEQEQELKDTLKTHIEQFIAKSQESIVEEVIKELDFGFLQNQPQVFYDVIINSIGELITNKLEHEYLQEQFQNMGKDIFKKVSTMQELKHMQLEAQLHLMSLSAHNEIKAIEEANATLMKTALQEQRIKEEFKLESLRLQNALLLEEKRKEALQSGKLPQEQINQFSYKVV